MAERHSELRRWVRLAADFDADPRLRRAGNDAELIYLRALGVMKLRDSEGYLAVEWWDDVTRGLRPQASTAALRRLLDAGLWEECDGGWRLPEGRWARWQDTAEDRSYERERKARWRAARRKAEENGDEP